MCNIVQIIQQLLVRIQCLGFRVQCFNDSFNKVKFCFLELLVFFIYFTNYFESESKKNFYYITLISNLLIHLVICRDGLPEVTGFIKMGLGGDFSSRFNEQSLLVCLGIHTVFFFNWKYRLNLIDNYVICICSTTK